LSYKGFVKEEAAIKPAEPGVLAGFRPTIQQLTETAWSPARLLSRAGAREHTPSGGN